MLQKGGKRPEVLFWDGKEEIEDWQNFKKRRKEAWESPAEIIQVDFLIISDDKSNNKKKQTLTQNDWE